ncbi:retrotransposon protein, putative, ty1-copia subclass [Tanacetum coccineum]
MPPLQGGGSLKGNCPVYLVELLKKKKQVGSASSSGIFTIELFDFPNKSRVYDTSCGTHIFITKQRFREARKLKQRALYLYVGNGVYAQLEAIESYDLVLSNGLVICLDNCHYAPSITRVSKNNVFYFNVIPSNGIYEINMHDLVPNVNSIYNVSTKRAKHNLDSTYLWHCRLAHISKKHIEKLQQEGLLKSTDDELFDQCASFLSGKMTRKSFLNLPERATDLLGNKSTDDDYSHYGYVYLLKHKHEVFETFKVFKNEVENQLGKIIKTLRSDRGGEYISQEFKDYLKACGIIQQLNHPYTPQHNGVSERRNHTLFDMIRSMMNLTTLSLSFWDYTLKSTTRILNMVPTKKVDQIPYELWYGKVPNLSYLKVWGSWKNKIVVVRYAEFFEKNLITQEVSGRALDLEEVQDEDTSPSKITIEIPMEIWGGRIAAFKFLGIKIYRDRSKRLIRLGQNAYMDKILKRYKMDNSKRGYIPMQERLDLNKTQVASTLKEVKRMKNVPYASAVGPLCAVDRKSSNQSTTAMSTTEAEYIVVMEAVLIRKYISGLGARHYHRRYHYVRESIALGKIRFLKVHTDDNMADPFTKALPKGKLTQHARSMGLRLASSFM